LFYSNYLNKRAVNIDKWKISLSISEKIFSSIIIIPAYYESKYILDTLSSIDKQTNYTLSNLLVIVVVNNSVDSSKDVIDDNIKTISLLESIRTKYSLRYIDASNNGQSLPIKLSGVGYARKIGMDAALKYANEQTIIHCLDTLVSTSYLEKISLVYKKQTIKALIVDFEHNQSKNARLNKCIDKYETFLKSTAKAIRDSGSPYGYVSLGPTITCLAKTYVDVGGMVNKKATEDFYFLQQIRKYTPIYFLDKKLVFPSSRLSNRVYLGTGFRMAELLNGKNIRDLYYSKKSFIILKSSIKVILNSYKLNKNNLRKKIHEIDRELNSFFENEGLYLIWGKINKESKKMKQFELQFHKWFDNLKTIRLLKYYS